MTAPAVAPSRAAPARIAWWGAVAALAVVAASLLALPYYGDQALYAVIGRELLHGVPLYTGVWDIKQPGIFLWYGLLGGVPALTRAADVAAALGVAMVVGALLRPHVSPAVGRWTPLAAAAVLLLPVRALDLGQVEQLVGLPALGALALAAHGAATNGTLVPLERTKVPFVRMGTRFGAAGVLIGVVASFKIWAVAIPLAAVLVLLVASRQASRARLVALAAGIAVPVVAVLVWLALTGALGAALATWFVGPADQLAQPGARTLGRLASGAGRFVLVTAPVLALAGWRLPTVWRRRDALDLALVAWLLAGAAVIAVQLWWSYHWVLLTPALLALAARQVSDVRLPRRAVLALAVAALPLLAAGAAGSELAQGGGLTAASREAITDELGSAPRVPAELAAAGVRPGERLYVLGDPAYQLAAGVPYPVRLNGWTPELFTDAQWAELASSLDAARPAVVFLESGASQIPRDRGNALLHMIDDHYVMIRRSAAGTWYRLDAGKG